MVSLASGQQDVKIDDQKHENKTTTTEKPTTTTEKPTTTTEKPTPKPKPDNIIEPVSGNITSDEKVICLRYHFALVMKLSFKDAKTNQTVTEDVILPKDAKVHSNKCTNKDVEYFWFEFGKSKLNLTFEHNEASVYMASLFGNITLEPKYNQHIILNGSQPYPNFNVDKSHSYVCANEIAIKIKSTDSDLMQQVIFSNLTLQAFMPPSQNGTFSDEHNCQNEINDVVPIAVGIALTSLVIIVMIAYFVGRRRSRRLTYQSV